MGCPSQVAGAIKRWVTKLDIKDLGDSLISSLVDAGNIREPAHLYYLTPKALAHFQMSGKKVGHSTANKVVNAIQATKELPLAKLVGSLGIDMCSRSICEKLVQAGFDTLGKMVEASEADIAAVPGMGDRKAASFVSGLKERAAFINNLLDAGVCIKKPIQGNLSGKLFCFSGFRDGALERAIEKQGGLMKGNVSKSLNYLVAEDPKGTSGKLAKARGYGVIVIGQEELQAMLGG